MKINKQKGLFLSAGLILLGILLVYFGIERPITIDLEGQITIIPSRALTVRQALKDAQISVTPQDAVQPKLNQFLGLNSSIKIRKNHVINFYNSSSELFQTLQTTERIPGNLFLQAGIHLFPGDQILWNGEQVPADQPLLLAPNYFLQYEPAISFTVEGKQFYSSKPTIGGALWDHQKMFSSADQVVPGLASPLIHDQAISISQAQPVIVRIGKSEVTGKTSAKTVKQALSDLGIPLGIIDYSIPDETSEIPSDRIIQVIHVEEKIIIEQTTTPFESEFVADPNTPLDERSVVQAGQYGIQAKRIRIRMEDGKEISRTNEAEWKVQDPVNQKVGYGTQVVVRTLDTPSGPIEYWRAVNVYATSYSPCQSGGDKCHYGTSSGLPVQRGVIAVTLAWYLDMRGQAVYIPNYGQAVIGDVGGGIPGKYWIDLAFTDDDFEAWYYDTTLYFLTPVPDTIPWILP